MSEPLLVEFFVEDTAHLELLVPLARRLGREEEIDLRCQVRNARGGHAGAMSSFKRYQILREKGVGGGDVADLLVVAIDGNCSSFAETRRNIRHATRDSFSHMLVTACPDPHIERWYLADPQSFQSVVGTRPSPRSGAASPSGIVGIGRARRICGHRTCRTRGTEDIPAPFEVGWKPEATARTSLVPQADPEAAAAVFDRAFGQPAHIDGKIRDPGRERVEGGREPRSLEAIPDSGHPGALGLPPLGRLQRHVDPGRQQPEEPRDHQPRPRRGVEDHEVLEFPDRGGTHEVDDRRRDEEQAARDLGPRLERGVPSPQQDRHRQHAEEGGPSPKRHLQADLCRKQVVEDRGRAAISRPACPTAHCTIVVTSTYHTGSFQREVA